MVGQHIQHYRIVRQLGAGGMGVVYEAEDTRLGRHVALKFLPEHLSLTADTVERFEREARIASSLNHPNICTIYDIGTHEGRRFIAMELVDGESLRSRIHGQPLPLDTILDLGCQLADALDAAHKKGIVHRDIKPANVFITRRGQAKLLDFGIAKLGGDSHAAAPADDATRVAGDVLTTPGVAVGSINYMSPEQARGEELDGRSDLFSLGVVLYEMATGHQAFGGQTTAVVFDAILNRQPADLRAANPAIPEDVARVVLRSLEKDRKMRFQTAADMLAELGRARRDTTMATAGAAATGGTVAAPRPSARPKWLAFAGLAVAAAGIAGYFLWTSTRTIALTDTDTILIADFVNSTGDPVFDDALRQAVAVQLQQTPFLQLLPDQRIQRTIRMMQQPPEAPVTGDVARQACQRAGAKATVEGSIAPLGSAFVISIGVHNCQTGAPLAVQQTQAANKESVLKELGLAVSALRGKIGESLATIQKYDVPVTDATTGSLDALRAYGLGNKTRAAKGDEASIPFFKQAIEHDPNFALAYAKLGVVYSNLGRRDEAREAALKAWGFRDRVSEYERLYIDYNYAARVLNDQDKVRESLELLTTAYPRDFSGHNNLGVYYNSRGDFEKSLASYRAAMALAPDEPITHSNAAYVLLFLGRLEEAYAEADQSLALRPDTNLAISRWTSAVVAGHPRAAEFEQQALKFTSEDRIYGVRAQIALWRGQLQAFEGYQEQAAAKARAANDQEALLNIELGTRLSRAIFQGGPAIAALEEGAATEKNTVRLGQTASALAMLGRVDTVRQILVRLRAQKTTGVQFAVTEAYVMAHDGKTQDAIAKIEGQLREQPRAQDLHAVIGRIRELSGDAKGAIANYETVIKAQSYFGLAPVVPLTRLMLADLLEKQGDAAGAKVQYDALRQQWKDADDSFTIKKRVK
jgi:tetratricopeptide (TPR) repeat protein/predicted Ser/Thr protein kinase